MTHRRALIALALACLAPPALAQPAPTLDSVMAALAARRQGHARFTETREFPELSMPLPSSGTLSWAAPDRLEKHTTEPVEEILRIEGDRLVFARPAQNIRRELGLDEQPELRPLVESIRATLAGDLPTLQRHYEVRFAAQPDGGWRIDLTPRSMRVYAALQSVAISGRGDAVLSVVTRGNQGETRMTIQPEP
ncbi:LolA family protein [Teichococcus oryzae]|uniref:Outer membrane lipoprotein carrier protein LolA n=1 Tax=Teichococcus oryzae TaxID=1608942 RepID=A0A5B2TF26_9PROT|nr:outer membrane lipoprotein carrier protein LolA [Pseudoroseomonas oryzae]KAA2213057.1 outer membrane lipoprotein carrier protein LolA [Pseudoroseomonas oryzae]